MAAVNMHNSAATIAAAASLSDEVVLNGANLVAIMMPAAWTAAALTFQGAVTAGGTFGNLYDVSGVEVTIPSTAAAAGQMVSIPAGAFDGVQAVKVRSGTAAAPVAQVAAAALTLVARRYL